jgi:hypothetical protein
MILKTLETPAKIKIIIASKSKRTPNCLSELKKINISPSISPSNPYQIIQPVILYDE